MNNGKLTLSDREKIAEIRSRYGHDRASHSFLSLFLYEESFGYKTTVCEDGFYVQNKDGAYLFPCGSDGFKTDFLLSHKGEKVCMMRESDCAFAKSVLPDTAFEEDPDEDEYVYDLSEQISLQGHKFQRVRAKLSKFLRENAVSAKVITEENVKDAYGVLSAWSPKAGEGDAAGAKKALDNFNALGLSGVISYLDGKPVGYVCGADIGRGVLMLCSAKQTSDIQGLNIYTKLEYYKTLSGVALVNTESDHGSAGIRMHKNDLRPVFLNKTYKGAL